MKYSPTNTEAVLLCRTAQVGEKIENAVTSARKCLDAWAGNKNEPHISLW